MIILYPSLGFLKIWITGRSLDNIFILSSFLSYLVASRFISAFSSIYLFKKKMNFHCHRTPLLPIFAATLPPSSINFVGSNLVSVALPASLSASRAYYQSKTHFPLLGSYL